MPTGRRWRCSRATPRPRSTCSRPPPGTASPASPASPPTRSSRRSAAEPRLAALVAAAPVPVALPVKGGLARVEATNTAWNPATERLEPRFAFAAEPAGGPVPQARGNAARDILDDLWTKGRAAGNHGDLYDNRDRGHSRLDPADHPQLSHVAYAEAARAADLDYGLNERLLFDRPTIGNSSTAITGGALWRSLPRAAMTRPDGTGPFRLWQNAAANHLYVYPAHKDFTDEDGDLFPANTPYILVSRGSSGSDRRFLGALALILPASSPRPSNGSRASTSWFRPCRWCSAARCRP